MIYQGMGHICFYDTVLLSRAYESYEHALLPAGVYRVTSVSIDARCNVCLQVS
jgi:hypothetical protein